MYRTLAGLIAAVGGALLLAGFSFSAASSQPADLRILNVIEPESLDPHQVNGPYAGRIATAIFEGLTRHDARSLEAAPGVAQSWDISDDGLRYTFHLREGAHWSDGVALGAGDFIYSWRRLLTPETGAKFAYLMHVVRGGRAMNSFDTLAHTIESSLVGPLSVALEQARQAPLTAEVWRKLTNELPLHDCLQHSDEPSLRELLDEPPAAVSVERLQRFIRALPAEAARLRSAADDARARFGTSLGAYAPDPHTLVVELEAPTPYFLDLTSFYATFAVPRHVVEKFGTTWFLPASVVSNGPFLLESWRVNDRIRLKRDPSYWGASEVRAQAIELYPIENPTTGMNMFLTGEADWLPSAYPTDLVKDLMGRPDFYTHTSFTTYFYRFNTRRPPLDDARVRQAINLAIDRQQIVDRVLGLSQQPADHLVPPGVPGYEPPPSPIRLDVDRARQLLADAGFPNGQGFPSLGILYNTVDMHKKIAEVIADQLRKNLGIDLRPYNQEWQSYSATVRALGYDMARASWVGDYLDPNAFLELWVSNGSNNLTGWSSHRYDALIRAAANTGAFIAAPEALLGGLAQPARLRALLDQHDQAAAGAARRDALKRVRMQLLAEAEAILVGEEFPILPIFYYVNTGFKAPGLRGLYTEIVQADGTRSSNLQPLHPLRDMWVEPTAR